MHLTFTLNNLTLPCTVVTLQCAVPQNIYNPLQELSSVAWGGRVQKPKPKYEAKLKFPRGGGGVQTKKKLQSIGGVQHNLYM